MPIEEAGDRHLFLAPSARYFAGEDDAAAGVSLSGLVALAYGTTGETGSGVYSIDASVESASSAMEQVLAALRDDGMAEKVVNTIEADIESALAAKIEA